jgi:hypothetical protein
MQDFKARRFFRNTVSKKRNKQDFSCEREEMDPFREKIRKIHRGGSRYRDPKNPPSPVVPTARHGYGFRGSPQAEKTWIDWLPVPAASFARTAIEITIPSPI